jgi:hypothetical protein
VARINPLGKIKDVALGTLLHPVGTAGKAVEQAKGTAAIGRMVAGQVTRAAASVAVDTVGGVAKRAGVPGQRSAPAEPSTPSSERRTRGDEPNLRAVPAVNEPAHTAAPSARPVSKAAKTAVAEPVAESTKNHGDLLEPVQDAVKKAPTKTASAKRAASKKAPATKAPAKKATAKKATANKATAKKTVAKTTVAKTTAAKTTAAKTTAASGDTGLLEAQTPASQLAEQGLGDVTPADVAKVAKKTPAKKTTPVQPVDGAPDATATKATKKTATKTAKKAAPRTASEVANEEGPDLLTPVGTTAAGESALPNTDLQQPGTEPLMDPATVNAVKSESETMQKAADPDKS